jgi:hypothetical protein
MFFTFAVSKPDGEDDGGIELARLAGGLGHGGRKRRPFLIGWFRQRCIDGEEASCFI